MSTCFIHVINMLSNSLPAQRASSFVRHQVSTTNRSGKNLSPNMLAQSRNESFRVGIEARSFSGGAPGSFSNATLQKALKPQFPSHVSLPIVGSRKRPLSPKDTIRRASTSTSSPLPPAHVDYISSVSNPYVKHCVKLRSSRGYREKSGTLLLCGEVLLREAIQDGLPLEVRCLMLAEGQCGSQVEDEKEGLLLHPFMDLNPHRTVEVSEAVLRKVSGVESASSLVAVAEVVIPHHHSSSSPQALNPDQLGSRVLALDGVQDPGNLGTLIRTALAFGWSSVVLLPSCCDAFNDKAIRAARGASFKVPIFSAPWEELHTVSSSFGIQLLAADIDGTQPEDVLGKEEGLNGGEEQRICLVMGSEGQGLSDQVMEVCKPVTIPMSGNMESLNVAVAGGILMYLLRRRAS